MSVTKLLSKEDGQEQRNMLLMSMFQVGIILKYEIMVMKIHTIVDFFIFIIARIIVSSSAAQCTNAFCHVIYLNAHKCRT